MRKGVGLSTVRVGGGGGGGREWFALYVWRLVHFVSEGPASGDKCFASPLGDSRTRITAVASSSACIGGAHP